MDLEEVLRGYEDLWRKAALEDQVHFFGEAAEGTAKPTEGQGPYGGCAYFNPQSQGSDDLCLGAQYTRVAWCCPKDGYKAASLSVVMIHLNNAHHWSWDMFANKFRDALAAGSKKGESK